MIAFHGSPVRFDRFDPAKIGSQWRNHGASGRGIYLTDSRDVATGYAVPGWRGGAAVRAQDDTGFVYEVEAPAAAYIDCDTLCDEQPEPAKSIFRNAVSVLHGPMARWWLHVLADAPNSRYYYSQVGKLLCFARKNGSPLEPVLAEAGYVGSKKRVEVWNGACEFCVFQTDRLRILSAQPHQRIAA
ncbi:hypothetical protein [Mesorhizobium helmanticense]|uniref:PARP catalytic domain-containing protein n=1 Tax=Mesorhizobium helmanticense TaxID=1776423 RepID=A0A2T4J0W6_9HYPH|nr:hypothetical protein [Mesorhizobium helmanticense]PTE11539.1 hypothetical protein C9427_04775 [Mesorhizobium helmanticense]